MDDVSVLWHVGICLIAPVIMIPIEQLPLAP